MTGAPHWLDEVPTPSALAARPRTLDKYAIEGLGTFGLVLTVGVGLGSRTPMATLSIAVVLMPLIYSVVLGTGARFTPAITLAAALWGRMPYGEAAAYWLAQ